MHKKSVTVAVSGLNNVDSPGPGIPVIRALRESELFDSRIIGVAYENLEPGPYMPNVVDKTYMVPYPSEGVDTLLERIGYIHDREKIDVLIPNFDSEIFVFIKLAPKLAQMGIQTFLPFMSQFEERHKSHLSEFGIKYGINVPVGMPVTSLEGIDRFLEETDRKFPLLVKGKFYDAHMAYTIEQVRTYFNTVSAKWGLPVILQEFIRGTEVNVVALGDGTGNTIGAVPMRKQYITDKGKAWGGITLEDPALISFTYRLMQAIKWRGGLELELIRTADNELYLIEINPRLPAWVYLAVAAGQNLPEALVRLALGEAVSPFTSYESGKMFIRYSYDMICELDDFRKLSTTGEL